MDHYAEAWLRLWLAPMIASQSIAETWLRAVFRGFPEIDRDLPRKSGSGKAQLPVPNPHQLEKDRSLFA